MSYILDALRRADADRERERGAVPGLHARPIPGALPEAPARTPPAVWMAAAGAVLAVLAGVVWWALRSPAPAAPPAQVAMAPAANPLPAPQAGAPAIAQQVPPPMQQPAVQPPVLAQPAPPARPPLAAQPPVAAVQMPPIAQPPAQRQVPAPPPARPAPPPDATQPAAANAALPRGAAPRPPAEPAAPRPLPLAELPAELRREMPPMSVGGSIYSDSAASRFVMINGQVVREGEAAAPGVVLERIGPKAAVLRWRDLRIEVPL
jgi:general secretion pathway protein B